MKAYFISGLGADASVFHRIKLPSRFDPVFLNWIEPLKDETFESYAGRLSQPIDAKEDFILVGLSLGGMMAVEMNKFLKPELTVLISSAVHKNELPRQGLLLGKAGIHKILPEKLFHSNNLISSRLIGLETKEDKSLAAAMIAKASIHFFRWAIDRIIRWENDFVPENMIRLHGTKDNIIPFPKDKNIIPVTGGTHFMVFNRANEINEILWGKLSN